MRFSPSFDDENGYPAITGIEEGIICDEFFWDQTSNCVYAAFLLSRGYGTVATKGIDFVRAFFSLHWSDTYPSFYED